jgi:hypothetical protein
MTARESPLHRAASRQLEADDPVEAAAICLDCGADIADWRERLLPIRAGSLAVTERGDLALHIERKTVCDECGGGRAEVRVQARQLPGA